MGQVPNRSAECPGVRLLGSFRNFAVGSFRNRRYPPVAAPFRHGTAMRHRLRKKSFRCPTGQKTGVPKCIPEARRTHIARLIASRIFRGDREGLFPQPGQHAGRRESLRKRYDRDCLLSVPALPSHFRRIENFAQLKLGERGFLQGHLNDAAARSHSLLSNLGAQIVAHTRRESRCENRILRR
jgi:hypothetical protein